MEVSVMLGWLWHLLQMPCQGSQPLALCFRAPRLPHRGVGLSSGVGGGLLPSLALRFSPAVKPGEIHTPNREPINNPRGPSHTHHDVQPPPLPGYKTFSLPPKASLHQLGVPPGPLPSEPDTSVLSASGFAHSG